LPAVICKDGRKEWYQNGILRKTIMSNLTTPI